MAPDEDPATNGKDATAALLEIRDLLEVRLPRPRPPKSKWRPRLWHVWTALLLLALAVVDFPSETQRNADLLVLNGSEMTLVKLPEPDWASAGLRASSEYWRIPQLPANVSLASLLELSLYRQGRRYKHSAIRAVRHENESIVDLLSPPVTIEGPTDVILAPLYGFTDADSLLASRVVRMYAICIDGQVVPLSQLVDNSSLNGRFAVETRPRMGRERFVANLATAFALLR